jgi:hypothetical protein
LAVFSCSPIFRVIEKRKKAQGKGIVLLPFDMITSLQVVPPVVKENDVNSISIHGANNIEGGVNDEFALDCVSATLAPSSSKLKSSAEVASNKNAHAKGCPPVHVVHVRHFEMVDHELNNVCVHHIIIKRRAFFPNFWCQIRRDRIGCPRSKVSVGGMCCKVISKFCCCCKTRFSSAFVR